MNKAVFLLCPADHLCPSQTGGLDLDYLLIIITPFQWARSIGLNPGHVVIPPQCTVDFDGCRDYLCRHHEQSGIGSSWRSAAPHSQWSSSNVHKTPADRAPPSRRRRLNLYPTISPPLPVPYLMHTRGAVK